MIISHQITRPARRKWSGASKEGCICEIHVYSINNASIVEINAWMKSKMELLHSSDKRIPLTIFKLGIEKQHFQRTIIANMIIVAICGNTIWFLGTLNIWHDTVIKVILMCQNEHVYPSDSYICPIWMPVKPGLHHCTWFVAHMLYKTGTSGVRRGSTYVRCYQKRWVSTDG